MWKIASAVLSLCLLMGLTACHKEFPALGFVRVETLSLQRDGDDANPQFRLLGRVLDEDDDPANSEVEEVGFLLSPTDPDPRIGGGTVTQLVVPELGPEFEFSAVLSKTELLASSNSFYFRAYALNGNRVTDDPAQSTVYGNVLTLGVPPRMSVTSVFASCDVQNSARAIIATATLADLTTGAAFAELGFVYGAQPTPQLTTGTTVSCDSVRILSDNSRQFVCSFNDPGLAGEVYFRAFAIQQSPLSDTLFSDALLVVVDDEDTDQDGQINFCDSDDDNDGVPDLDDPQPLDPQACGDTDGDGCDDCSVGTDGFGPNDDQDPTNDGSDNDGDGLCDSGDPDDDNDGVPDTEDDDPFDRFTCADTDNDGCDDCSSGTFNPNDDGVDLDGDGRCDSGDGGAFDPDLDNDGVPNDEDPDPGDPTICGDSDGDGCDDCTTGRDGFGPLADALPNNDGPDFDGDGLCDSGDPDIDNDGIGNAEDPDDFNPYVCGDSDGDGCDDCSVGKDGLGPLTDFMPNNDGADFDGDGLCDSGDPDIDNDGVGNADDPDDFNPDVCGDADGDGIDDCSEN